MRSRALAAATTTACCAALAIPGARGGVTELGTGKPLLDDVFAANFFWPAQNQDYATLTVATEEELEHLCELQTAWTEEENGSLAAPEEAFAQRFRGNIVLVTLPLPCKLPWSERQAISPLAILNASVLVFHSTANTNPLPESYFHDGNKFEQFAPLKPLQWLATTATKQASALRDDLLFDRANNSIQVKVRVDPNPWQAEFQRPVRRFAIGFCAASSVFGSLLACKVLLLRRRLGRNKIWLPSFVLTSNLVVGAILGFVVVGWNGFRIYARLSVGTMRLFATAFHSTTTANDFLLVLFWAQLVSKSMGGADTGVFIPSWLVKAGAVLLYAMDWLAGLSIRAGMSRVIVLGIMALVTVIFQTTALVQLNKSTRAALKLLRTAASAESGRREGDRDPRFATLVWRTAVLVRIATVSSIASCGSAFLYASGRMQYSNTPSDVLTWEVVIILSDSVNRIAQTLVFWPIEDTAPRISAVAPRRSTLPTRLKTML